MNEAKQTRIPGMTSARTVTDSNYIDADYDKLHQFGAMGKAFSILETVTANRQPLSMTELARVTGMTKPTAHRIVNVLSELRFIERDRINRGYIEGPRLINFALQTLSAAAPRTLRHSILSAMAEEIGETCTFGVLAGPEVILVDQMEAKWPLGLRFDVGSRVPAYCTAIGKLLLSQQTESSKNEILKTFNFESHTDNTITDIGKLKEELINIRSTMVGIDNQEFITGVNSVGVSVVAANGDLVGAISISAPQARLSLSELLEHVPTMRKTANKLGSTFDVISSA